MLIRHDPSSASAHRECLLLIDVLSHPTGRQIRAVDGNEDGKVDVDSLQAPPLACKAGRPPCNLPPCLRPHPQFVGETPLDPCPTARHRITLPSLPDGPQTALGWCGVTGETPPLQRQLRCRGDDQDAKRHMIAAILPLLSVVVADAKKRLQKMQKIEALVPGKGRKLETYLGG